MIDVIIPVYNCELYIENCLNSIKNQTIKINSIYVLDDSSSDSSISKINGLNSSISFTKNDKNSGNLKTINGLLAQTSSELIAFQDADDWSDIQRLEYQIQFLQDNNLDFCFTNYIKTTQDGLELYCGLFYEKIITLNNIQDLEPEICFASILFKRRIYDEVGGFDIYFDRIGGADIDWLYKIILAGFKGGVLEKPLYYYRNNETSYTSRASLDPRKSISLSIARYFYNYRKKRNEIHQLPDEKSISEFIRQYLIHINFDKKNNLKQYIIQNQFKVKKTELISLCFRYLVTTPHNWKDLGLMKYIAYKIVYGKNA